MQKTKAVIAGIGLVMGLSGVAQATPLITNGSFEDLDGVYPSGTPYVTLDSNSSIGIPGWTVTDGSIDWIGSYWKASDGTKSIDLAGYYTHGLILGTSFDTTPGETYRVMFDMAGNPDQDDAKALVAISTGDDAGDPNSLHTFRFDQTGHDKQNMGWETKYFDFVAQSTSAQLYFGDVTGQLTDDLVDLEQNQNEAWGAALDNVRVAPVPEPSTLLLLGAGLAGLGLLRRRNSRS